MQIIIAILTNLYYDTYAYMISHPCKHVGHLKGSSSLLSVAGATLLEKIYFS